MHTIALAAMLTALLCLNAPAQTMEGVFNRMEVSANGDTVRFNFINGKSETSVYLINRIDSLKTRISGDFIREKYALKEENGIKTLYIYLRPKWNYDNIKGMSSGKAYLSKQRLQRQRRSL